MNHLILLGDSIFDNATYVSGGPSVIDQIQERITPGDSATLLAVDGAVISEVARQLSNLPKDASHLFISVGGNDALQHEHILRTGDSIVSELPAARDGFFIEYRAMLDRVCSYDKPTTVCTIYDSIPGLGTAQVVALSVFNDIILREAFSRGIPVIDLRLVCSEIEDYSAASPIEPSSIGGAKIANTISDVAKNHDFTSSRSIVYR